MKFYRLIILFFSLQIFVLDKDELKAKLNEIIPDEISVSSIEDTYSSFTNPMSEKITSKIEKLL